MEFEKEQLEELFQERLTRRELVKRGAVVGTALSFGSFLAAGPAGARGRKADLVRWMPPRGTLDVMDDYNLWVAIQQGFFAAHNIEAKLIPGPISDALATTKYAPQHKIDMGYPSPGVLTASIDGGIDVISVWEMFPGQVFDFSLPADSKITKPQQLAGKSISLGSSGWSVIVDPMLVEVGVDPKSVKYVNAGAQWSQAVALHKADAGLCWEGLRGQLIGQGLKLKFLIGQRWSKFPSNSYSVRSADLSNAHWKDVYTRFFGAVVEAFEFTRTNPRAAAQITYTERPLLAKTLSPQLALESMVELASGYGLSRRQGHGYGFHSIAGWKSYLDIVHKLGQTKKHLTPAKVVTNQIVKPANSGANVSKARAAAKAYKLNSKFASTKVPPLPL